MARLLIQSGADPRIQDDLYHGDAEAAANHFGQLAVRDYLRSLAGGAGTGASMKPP